MTPERVAELDALVACVGASEPSLRRALAEAATEIRALRRVIDGAHEALLTIAANAQRAQCGEISDELCRDGTLARAEVAVARIEAGR